MKVTQLKTPIAQAAVDAIVVGVFSDDKLEDSKAPKAVAEIDRATSGLLTTLSERQEITGKKYDLTTLLAPPRIAAGQLLIVGLGQREKFDAGIAFRAAGAAAKQLSAKKRDKVAFLLGDTKADQTEAAIAGAIVACEGQDLYRAEKKRHPFTEIQWGGSDEATLEHGRIIGESMNLTRRLVNEPPQEIYPES